MQNEEKTEKFRQLVENKFQIYNSLFMSLPYDKMTNIGMLLPFLYEESKIGYEKGKSPEEIVEEFFAKHTELETEEQKTELLFKIIQYIERQVVLFDSIEDAVFCDLHPASRTMSLIWLSVNFALPFPDPTPRFLRLPLAFMSAMLSNWVPENR